MDECKTGVHDCSDHSTCVNTLGSFSCKCHSGYRMSGKTCVDINECADGNEKWAVTQNVKMAHCDSNAYCENVPGNYTCTCNEGYFGDGIICVEDRGTTMVQGMALIPYKNIFKLGIPIHFFASFFCEVIWVNQCHLFLDTISAV